MTRTDWIVVAIVIVMFTCIILELPIDIGPCDVTMMDGTTLRCQVSLLARGRLSCRVPGGQLLIDEWSAIERHSEDASACER